MNKHLKIPFDAPLHELDSETQTFGCRQKNPDICGNNSLPGVCAFTTDECICRKPSRAWKRQYTVLKVQAAK
ncbi:hypothetical protein B1774_04615 [Dehalococcoides mccartyi]|nr:hypothetical protein B1773_04970 [Dehalococcoides mccartyi]AQU04679.1 hypothetical protein B1774_04615 [Dehalococcoides mccartyi]